MAMSKWFQKLQPTQLYIILTLTFAFFIAELVVSHITHALTLLMDSYHTLCNIMALTGCIITMKYGKYSPTQDSNLTKKQSQSKASSIGEELTSAACGDKLKEMKITSVQESQLKKLKNTFGWARIDVISMLMCCVFLASFSFSIFVEALQTLVHIDHQDEMHYPITVFCTGILGLIINGLCYALIGGYTFHQGSFLYVTESGNVVLSKVVCNQSVEHGERRLSRTKYVNSSVKPQKQRQGLREMMRDVNGCIIVMICAVLIFFSDKNTAKYIDPIMSLVSATIIMILSYPYMKESCLILLQTIPDTINIDVLKVELLNHFPDIKNVHDFHIWQLTANKIFSTVHIIFENPKVYCKIKEEIKEFFTENGINQVTIQPEFFNKNASMDSVINETCLFACLAEGCIRNHCCPEYSREQKLGTSKESLSNSSDLKSVKIVVPASSIDPDKENVNEKLKNRINLDKNEASSENSHPENIDITITEDSRFDNVCRNEEHSVTNATSNEDIESAINCAFENKSNEMSTEMHEGRDQEENKQFIAREISTKYEEEDKNLYHEIVNTRKTIQLELNKE